MYYDKFTIALNRAMDNERKRIEKKGTKSIVITNQRKGFLAGLEHAMQIYKIFEEDNSGKS